MWSSPSLVLMKFVMAVWSVWSVVSNWGSYLCSSGMVSCAKLGSNEKPSYMLSSWCGCPDDRRRQISALSRGGGRSVSGVPARAGGDVVAFGLDRTLLPVVHRLLELVEPSLDGPDAGRPSRQLPPVGVAGRTLPVDLALVGQVVHRGDCVRVERLRVVVRAEHLLRGHRIECLGHLHPPCGMPPAGCRAAWCISQVPLDDRPVGTGIAGLASSGPGGSRLSHWGVTRTTWSSEYPRALSALLSAMGEADPSSLTR